ncbi:hypothetical protein [Microvirga thermotolerans]|uniref:Uncharacterized protein n=1 Tax=Microvirga thermotolerans TaxID=2651334 RepID=A0A5P9JYC5_9HYPH|nr:hypothetical protein [Microvirga thermotolerans]QFU16245.1 hypothetical protein GDR74_08425 [Microvirga thermotolerans]
MAGKANFTPDEWARIVASPMVAGMAITAAEPSGLWGLLKESMSSGWALLEAKQDAGASPLVREVAEAIADPATRDAVRHSFQDRFRGSQFTEVKGKAIAELRAVSTLLQEKAPEDAPAFRTWLRHVAQETAEAGKEGGFLGFGGVAVSDAEKATLDEIDKALLAPTLTSGIAET